MLQAMHEMKALDADVQAANSQLQGAQAALQEKAVRVDCLHQQLKVQEAPEPHCTPCLSAVR